MIVRLTSYILLIYLLLNYQSNTVNQLKLITINNDTLLAMNLEQIEAYNLQKLTYFNAFEPSDSFNFLLVWCGLWVTLFYILYKLINVHIAYLSLKMFLLILSPFIIIGTLVILYPTFSILIMLSFCSLLVLTSFNYEIYSGFQKAKFHFLKETLYLFKYIGLLDLCSIVYVVFFCVSPRRNTIFVIIIFFFNLLYIIVSRYHFLHRNLFLQPVSFVIEPLVIYTLLLIGLMFLYIRLFLLFSVTMTLTTKVHYPNLLHPNILFVFGIGEEPSPQQPPTPTPIPKPISTPVPHETPRYNFLNVNNTRNYYRHYYTDAAQNSSRLRTAGIWASIFGLGIGIATAKFTYDVVVETRKQVEIAQQQVRAQEVNNHEMSKQNSLEELSQGLITKEDYYRRHPESRPTTPPTEDKK